jgi:class 3 adenylate cyclase
VYVETLTFLFTDIEGSTALLGRLGEDDYAQLLAGHHALIRLFAAERLAEAGEEEAAAAARTAGISWPPPRRLLLI